MVGLIYRRACHIILQDMTQYCSRTTRYARRAAPEEALLAPPAQILAEGFFQIKQFGKTHGSDPLFKALQHARRLVSHSSA